MATPTRWTRVWANCRSWWTTGKPGVLQSMGSQRVRHDWVTELNLHVYMCVCDGSAGDMWRHGFDPWVGQIPWRRKIAVCVCACLYICVFIHAKWASWVLLLNLVITKFRHNRLGPWLEWPCCCSCCLVTSAVSDLVWPYGLQPTRLLCPWGCLGMSTGVGCHALL